MPVHPTYPGVYIEEIPSGVHPITGVATSIGAFIDYFSQGPTDTAVHILSFGDFQRFFGGLNTNSEASYAIQQFFLNGGSEAYVVRIGVGTAAAAVVLLEAAAGTAVATLTAGMRFAGNSVNNPGAWGNNLRVDVDYATTDATQLFNLTITLNDPVTGRPTQTEVFRNLTFQPGQPTYAPDVVNQASQLVQMSPPPGAAFPTAATWTNAYRPAETGAVGTTLPIPAGTMPADGDIFDITVTSDGTAAHTYTFVAKMALGSVVLADYPSVVPFLQAAIRSAVPGPPAPLPAPQSPSPELAALLSGATVQLEAAGTAAQHFRVVAGRGGGAFNSLASMIFADATGTTIADLKLGAATQNVQQYSLGITGATAGAQQALSGTTGVGANGKVPQVPISSGDAGSFATAIQGSQLNKTGIFALEDADLFNILCIPLVANFDASNYQAVITAATAYCDIRRAFLLLDIPSSVADPPTMQTWMAQNDTLRDINNAVYFPRTMIPDPLNNNRLRDVGPSGTIAGLFALTDVNRGVWKAPAGTEAVLRNVSQLVYKLTDGENGVLNPLGINCLRNFPIYGNICWGARTLDGADALSSDWKYVPIRRLALFLEESLYRGTKWAVFEPNDEPLWAQIRLSVGSFMQDLFRQGAFQGSTPQQAYLVKCDSETTTALDQANGIVNIVVGFAPLKPAEFVIIQIQQLAGQLAS